MFDIRNGVFLIGIIEELAISNGIFLLWVIKELAYRHSNTKSDIIDFFIFILEEIKSTFLCFINLRLVNASSTLIYKYKIWWLLTIGNWWKVRFADKVHEIKLLIELFRFFIIDFVKDSFIIKLIKDFAIKIDFFLNKLLFLITFSLLFDCSLNFSDFFILSFDFILLMLVSWLLNSTCFHDDFKSIN